MKVRIITLLIAGALAVAACAPAAVEAPVVEAAEPAEVMMPEAPAEEAMAEEAPAEMAAGSEVSFSADIWPVIEQFALEAHGGSGGVFLESYEDIMEYVVPGKPEESMLYKALTADGMKQMPPSGRLPDETIQLFYDWILQGAPNN